MAETQNNIATLHRKEWQTMMPAPTATAANSFVASDQTGLSNYSLYMLSATVHYLYHHDEDDWNQINSGAFSPALTAGACGAFHPWSITYTGNGGSTTTIQVAAATHNIVGSVVGKVVEFLTGTAANIGLRRTITAIKADNGTGNITLTLDSALPSAFANADTFRCNVGSFFIFTSGLLTTSSHRRFDLGTMSWVGTLSITGLAATWGTDGRMVCPARYGVAYDTGTATSGGATTLVDSGAGWGVDQFINFQVRITAGTGIGQVRVITDNDATTLTTAAWTTNPDSTSVYSIEGDENALYLLGNNAVTMYKYSISGNSWATVSPTTARAGATWDTIGITPFPLGQSEIGCYTVPTGKTAYILSKHVTVEGTKPADVYMFQRPNAHDVTSPYSGAMRLVEHEVGLDGSFGINFVAPKGPFVGPCDIGFMAHVTAGNSQVSVDFELLLVSS